MKEIKTITQTGIVINVETDPILEQIITTYITIDGKDLWISRVYRLIYDHPQAPGHATIEKYDVVVKDEKIAAGTPLYNAAFIHLHSQNVINDLTNEQK